MYEDSHLEMDYEDRTYVLDESVYPDEFPEEFELDYWDNEDEPEDTSLLEYATEMRHFENMVGTE